MSLKSTTFDLYCIEKKSRIEPIQRMGRDNRKNNRGGRGHSHKKNKNKDKDQKTTKRKTLADHIYYVGSAKQASDYVTVTNFIVNHVRRTFDKGDDIARALEDEVTYDLDQFAPTLRTSTKTEATKDRLKEACSINKSLSALGKVIRELALKSSKKKKLVV